LWELAVCSVDDFLQLILNAFAVFSKNLEFRLRNNHNFFNMQSIAQFGAVKSLKDRY
jgi:hypothetical protein